MTLETASASASASTSDTQDPSATSTTASPMLADFATAADLFFAAFSQVPDDALAFRPEGDDYALSGVLIHIAGALEFYTSTLASVVGAEFGPVTANGTPDPADVALTRDGIAPDARGATLDRLRQAHTRLVAQVQALTPADITRQAPVRFGDTAAPLPTSAADIIAWMRAHYEEHVPHIAELLAKWRAQ